MDFFVCPPKAFEGLYSSLSVSVLKSFTWRVPTSRLVVLSLARGSDLHYLILRGPQS